MFFKKSLKIVKTLKKTLCKNEHKVAKFPISSKSPGISLSLMFILPRQTQLKTFLSPQYFFLFREKDFVLIKLKQVFAAPQMFKNKWRGEKFTTQYEFRFHIEKLFHVSHFLLFTILRPALGIVRSLRNALVWGFRHSQS